jgi:hypothetical protein
MRAVAERPRHATKAGRLSNPVDDPTPAGRPGRAHSPPPLQRGPVARLPFALIAAVMVVIVVEVAILATRGSGGAGSAGAGQTGAALQAQLLALTDLPAVDVHDPPGIGSKREHARRHSLSGRPERVARGRRDRRSSAGPGHADLRLGHRRPLPQEGQQSAAYQIGLISSTGASGATVGLDVAVIQIADTVAVLIYATNGSPSATTFQALAERASMRLG